MNRYLQHSENDSENEEIFHESLDRILSSSNSSTSNSEDDNDAVLTSPFRCRGSRRNGLSVVAENYDVWTSTDSFARSSVEMRRDRLLKAMGLSSDTGLSRRQANRSVSFNNYWLGCESDIGDHSHMKLNVNRSKLDHNSSPSYCSSEIVPIRCVSDALYKDSDIHGADFNNVGGCGDSNCNGGVKDSVNCSGLGIVDNGGEVSSLVCMNKPAVRRNNSDTVQCVVGEMIDEEVEVDKLCRIKNLDTGKEFVVKEVGEDGTWNKLKEVGTGKQLTMEEFEMCVGHSPIVQELMRRQNVEDRLKSSIRDINGEPNENGVKNGENGSKSKKKVSWLKSIKNSVTGYKEKRSSDEKDSSSEKGGRRSSSATDDSHDSIFHGPERVRVRQYGKSVKDFTALYKSQEIQAHNGSIWTTKFSLDGKYLSSAGEDCVIHVWQVVEVERKGELLVDRPDDGSLNLLLLTNGSPELNSISLSLDSGLERKKGRVSVSRKSVSVEHIVVPETVFGLSEKPFCSFQGHSDDVLDLSWSKSQLLLSSSMDKTVRLWNLSSKSCLKIFSHSDYVTCIQFNPVDDRYFISGSLDAKVRIWSIPDHQVVDWNDLHEMVTAACYTPDGQSALVGSYKGSCRVYNTSENKLQRKCHINLQNKKKKSHLKKITGFQFAPGSSSEVLITSADSRVRVVDGSDLVHKFKGFRNTNSQIAASLTASGKYIVSASEDSHVYVWKHKSETRPSRNKGITSTHTYEHFHCQDVSVAIPWPGISEPHNLFSPGSPNRPRDCLDSGSEYINSPLHGSLSNSLNGYIDRISATWPEEKILQAIRSRSPRNSRDLSNGFLKNRPGWGLVIVTAGLRGQIRIFQNFGLPVRV